jgi:hypothetical protein
MIRSRRRPTIAAAAMSSTPIVLGSSSSIPHRRRAVSRLFPVMTRLLAVSSTMDPSIPAARCGERCGGLPRHPYAQPPWLPLRTTCAPCLSRERPCPPWRQSHVACHGPSQRSHALPWPRRRQCSVRARPPPCLFLRYDSFLTTTEVQLACPWSRLRWHLLSNCRFRVVQGRPPSMPLRRTDVAWAEAGQAACTGGPEGPHDASS